ncbi:YbaN family protein [Oceanobacillus sp. CAU 1775]
MSKVKRSLYIVLGLISFGIGVAGTILPVLPGGPFFLFASYCFTKSSERLDRWFKGTSFYKQYVDRYFIKKYMTKWEKIRINIIADFFIILSIFMVDILFVRIMMITLMLIKHYYFIYKIKTIKPEEIDLVLAGKSVSNVAK